MSLERESKREIWEKLKGRVGNLKYHIPLIFFLLSFSFPFSYSLCKFELVDVILHHLHNSINLYQKQRRSTQPAMVYAALPAAYLDPPNWNQQSQQQLQQGFLTCRDDGEADRTGRTEQQHQLPCPVPSQPGGGVGGASSAKPLSTADRARLAKLPQAESAPVTCPRCDSTNTKFCYFNNYSLSQPRHFCKACRRYWTRGGSLRNVPVGGGCRRNKRTKGGGSSKGSSAVSAKSAGAAASSLEGGGPGGGGAMNPSFAIQSHFPFLASLNPLPDYADTVAPNYGGIAAIAPAGYHHATGSTGGGPDQWINNMQLENFPYLAGMEPSPPPLVAPSSLGLAYQQVTTVTGAGTVSRLADHLHSKPTTCTGLAMQLPLVKTEGLRPQGSMNLLRPQLLGISGVVNNQYWTNTNTRPDGSTEHGDGTAPWTGISGFPSSAVNLL